MVIMASVTEQISDNSDIFLAKFVTRFPNVSLGDVYDLLALNLSTEHRVETTPFTHSEQWITFTDSQPGMSTENFSNVNNTSSHLHAERLSPSVSSVVVLSVIFFTIFLAGFVGNCLVVAVVVLDVKMRQSATNILITNLAVADLLIMILGVPEIVMFILNQGWLLGSLACRINRFTMVTALYSSVASLVTLCVERFIGIVFPFKVHDLCTRKTILLAIVTIWVISSLCGLPVIIFNQTITFDQKVEHCQIRFPGHDSEKLYLAYKYSESAIFYFLPMVVQTVLYSITVRNLRLSIRELSTQFNLELTSNRRHDTLKKVVRVRLGVVKMLMASVVLYLVSYSPVQVHLIYNTFSNSSIFESWIFFAIVMVATHLNSAANPVVYAIFNQSFRRCFRRLLCQIFGAARYRRERQDSPTFQRLSTRSSSTSKTYLSNF